MYPPTPRQAKMAEILAFEFRLEPEYVWSPGGGYFKCYRMDRKRRPDGTPDAIVAGPNKGTGDGYPVIPWGALAPYELQVKLLARLNGGGL